MRLPVVVSKGAVEEDVLADGRQSGKEGKASIARSWDCDVVVFIH